MMIRRTLLMCRSDALPPGRRAVALLLLATASLSAAYQDRNAQPRLVTVVSVTTDDQREHRWEPRAEGEAIIRSLKDSWEKEFSWGQLQIAGQVIPDWRHVAVTMTTSCVGAFSAARSVLVAEGHNPLGTMLMRLPGGPCNPSALGAAGAIIPGGRGTLLHEFGHTLGLGHAGAWICGPSGCARDEYGDYFSVMGGNWQGHPTPAQYEQLRWVGGPWYFQTITTSGTYDVPRVDTPGKGVKALKVPVAIANSGVTRSRTQVYYVVLRAAGLLIYRGNDLLDLDQATAANKRALNAGETFKDRESGLVVSALKKSPDKAIVSIVLPRL